MKIENPNKRNMLVGLLLCVAGLVVTIISYYTAKEGGQYSIYYGLCLWGVIQFGRGFKAHIHELANAQQKQSLVRWLLGGVAFLILFISALIWTVREFSGDKQIVDKEQIVELQEYAITINIPKGFFKVEEEVSSETDSTYAYHSVYSADEECEYVFVVTEIGVSDTVTIVDEASHVADDVVAFSDSLLEYPVIVNLGELAAMRHVEFFEEESVVKLSYALVHKGNLVRLSSYRMGTEVDSLQIAKTEQLILEQVVLR